MLDDNTTVVVLAAVVIGIELWRRSLRNRAARWVHVATLALLGVVAISIVYSRIAMRHVASAIEVAPSMKASALASGISAAMWGYFAAFVAIVLAAVVLAVANVRARNLPTDGPVAQVR